MRAFLLLFVVAGLGAKFGKEADVKLKIVAAKQVFFDGQNTLFVGGASKTDPKKGQIAHVNVETHEVVVGDTILAPILSLSLMNGKLYCGLGNGGIGLYDIASKKFVHYWRPLIEMMEVNFIIANTDEKGCWLAFRKATPGMDNWCFQQFFHIPTVEGKEFQLPDMKPSWDAFSGRHPGPCTGLALDRETQQLYYTDSTVRGRWMGIYSAFVRQETQWNNFNYIERSIVFEKAVYVLLRTGKIDSWTYDGWTKLGDPESGRSLQVDLGDRFSFELWKTLFGDEERESIWAGSEDGELVQFHATPTKFQQVASIKSSSNRRYGEGIVIKGELAIVDLQHDDESMLMFASVEPSCDILAGSDCYCSPRTDDKPPTCMFKSLEVKGSFSIPPDMEVEVSGDARLSGTVTIPLSSKLKVKGSIVAPEGSLVLQDAPNAQAEAQVVEGNFDGSFKTVRVDSIANIKRALRCLQYPSVSVTLNNGVMVAVSYKGAAQCVKSSFLIVFYLGVVFVLAVGGYFAFIKARQEIVQEQARKTI